MVKQVINIGVEGNDASGDPIRSAFKKANENFNELYSAFGKGDGISITALTEGPTEVTPDSILISNADGTQYLSKSLEGQGIDIINTDPTKITFRTTSSQLVSDLDPALSNNMSANSFNILKLGNPDVNVARAYGTTVDTFAVNKGYVDSNYVNIGGDVMTGPLYVPPGAAGSQVAQAGETVLKAGGLDNQMTGPLLLHSTIKDSDDPLTAATKEYVDLTNYYSRINLFVSMKGDDFQFDVSNERKGRSLAYAFQTISAAARWGENLINSSPWNVGPYVKTITYNNGDNNSVVSSIDSNGDGTYNLFISNDGVQSDPRDGNNIIPGQIIKGLNTGAVAFIDAVGDLTNNTELYVVRYSTTNGDATFEVGEELEWSDPVKDLQLTIFVESGNYYENYPIRVPQNTSIVGDELRRVLIRPRPGRSSSPTTDLYFRRDTEIDRNHTVDLDYTEDYAFTDGTINTTSVTPNTIIGQTTFILSSGNLPSEYIGYVFIGNQGRGIIIATVPNGFVVDLSTGLSDISTIARGDWHIYKPINFGYHYLTDTTKPLYTGTIRNNGNFVNAASIIQNNKQFLIEETIGYVNQVWKGLDYDQRVYRQNIGSVIDAVAYDMAFGSNYRSIREGQTYYRDPLLSTFVLGPGKTVTLDSLDNLKTLLQGQASDTTSDSRINSSINLIKDIITNGEGTRTITWDPPPGADSGFINARNLILNNRYFIRAETIAYINSTFKASIVASRNGYFECSNSLSKLFIGMPISFNGSLGGVVSGRTYYINYINLNDKKFTISTTLDGVTLSLLESVGSMTGTLVYDLTKYNKDIDLLVEAIVYDLTYYGNSQSIATGNSYYSDGILMLDDYEKISILDGYNHLKTMIAQVATGAAFIPIQTNVPRVGSTLLGSSNAGTFSSQLVENVRIIIDTSNNPAVNNPSVGWASTEIQTDFNAIENNISNTQDTAIDYINDNYFQYDSTLCRRDLGFIIDALTSDLIYGTYYRSLEAGNSFFENSSALKVIDNIINVIATANPPITELEITVATVQYLGTITKRVIKNLAPVTEYQNAYQSYVSQVVKSSLIGEDDALVAIDDLVTFIEKIMSQDSSINPPKNNDEIDVFLMNNATILRELSCQEHGGFMVVLDPLSRILTKSPYMHKCSSFSKSINKKHFAGGMLVDGFSGNLSASITSRVSSTQVVVNGLTKRAPLTPSSFYINGIRFEVDTIANYNQVNGTATVNISPLTPDEQSYTGVGSNLLDAPLDIEFLSTGNLTMCASDFTQVNDLGYGVIGVNLSVIELVSVFSYYCQVSYFSGSGSQIIASNGASTSGAYGLISSGSSPLEVPNVISLKYDMVVGATVMALGNYVNAQYDLILYVDGLTTDYNMVNQSELEVVHGNAPDRYIQRYLINNVQLVTDNGPPRPINGSLYRIILASGGLGSTSNQGLQEALADGAQVVIRQNGSLWIQGIAKKTATRPSTALVMYEDTQYVYRIIGIGQIASKFGIFTWVGNTVTVVSPGHNLINGQEITASFSGGTNGDPSTGFYNITLISNSEFSISVGVFADFESIGTISFSATILEAQVDLKQNFRSVNMTVYYDANNQINQPFNHGVIGSHKLAIRNLAQYDVSRIKYGMENSKWVLVGWAGQVHRITNYISSVDNGTDYAIIEIDGLLGPGWAADVGFTEGGFKTIPNLKGVLPGDSSGDVTVDISTVRASNHAMILVGSGSFATTNLPSTIYGQPDLSTDQAAEVIEVGKGRVFYVTNDQDGNFRVGEYFKVDQGTGTVTFSSSIAISNLDGLGFKRGVAIAEFSVDDTMTDNATDKVPVEQAVRSYIDRRLGLSHYGTVVPANSIIPTTQSGFMSLDGKLGMKANMNLNSYRILNLGAPTSGSDATNKTYVDSFLKRVGGTRTGIEGFQMSASPNGVLDMNGNNIINIGTPLNPNDVATKAYVDAGLSAQNQLSELSDVTVNTPANNDLFVYNGTKWVNGTQTGDVLFTLSGNTLTSSIQPNKIVNSMVSNSAGISQSKLSLNLATAGTSNAAVQGIASFNSTNFSDSSGFISIKDNGVTLNSIVQLPSNTVVGNSSNLTANADNITFSTVVQNGGALYTGMFSNDGAVIRSSGLYTTTPVTTSATNGTIVARDSQNGGFAATIINATTQLNIGNVKALGNSGSSPNQFLEMYTPQGALTLAIRTVSGSPTATVYGAWTLNTGATLESTYSADIAEYYQGDKLYEVGTVLMIGGEFDVTLAKGEGTRKVAGVVSDNAAFVMYKECPGEKNLVALQGRVPCKVIGKIEKGDLMVVSSVSGVATASDDPKTGSIIGKALQNYNSDHIGLIEVMVGKH